MKLKEGPAVSGIQEFRQMSENTKYIDEEAIDLEDVLQEAYDDLEDEAIRKHYYRQIAVGIMDLQVENEVIEHQEKRRRQRKALANVPVTNSIN